jgi:hypothetical protein
MKKILLMIWFLVFYLPTHFVYADEQKKETDVVQISKEDLEIIKVLEILKLMDMMKYYDLVKDMEILSEEDNNENNN